jgi:hypothetical protein
MEESPKQIVREILAGIAWKPDHEVKAWQQYRNNKKLIIGSSLMTRQQ